MRPAARGPHRAGPTVSGSRRRMPCAHRARGI